MTKYALNAEEGVVLRDTLGPGGSTGLDLASAEGDDQVSNQSAFGLTAAVRDHDTPAVGLRELSTVKCDQVSNLGLLE